VGEPVQREAERAAAKTQQQGAPLAEIKDGKAGSVPTSEPYGCSVKYGS